MSRLPDASKPLMKNRLRTVLWILLAVYFTLFGGTALTAVVLEFRVFHHVVLILIFTIWLTGKLRHQQTLPTTPLDWPLLINLGVALVAVIFAYDPRLGLEELWSIGVHTLLFYILVDLMQQRRPDVVLRPIFLSITVLILMGLFEFTDWYFGLVEYQTGWWDIGGAAHPIPPFIDRGSMLVGALGPNLVAATVAMGLPMLGGWALASRSQTTRRALWIVTGGGFIFLLLIFSRGAIASLAAGVAVFSALYLVGHSRWQEPIQKMLRDRRIQIGVIIAVIILGAGGAYLIVRLGDVRAQVTGVSAAGGDSVRLDMWHSALLTGWYDPLTGIGPRGFGVALRMYQELEIMPDNLYRPDSLPLLIWAETGLPGVLVWLWIGITGMRAAYQRWQQTDGNDRLRVAGMWAGLCGFAVHNIVESFVTTPNVIIALMAGAYLIYPLQPERQSTRRVRLVPAIVLGLVALAGIGWTFSHRAYALSRQAQHAFLTGDYYNAIQTIEQAERLDPGMKLYTAQNAQYLGRLALEDEAYLDEALQTYEQTLDDEGTFDVLRANHAVLLRENGQQQEAAFEMVIAADVAGRDAEYYLWAGQYQEAIGEISRATSMYRYFLKIYPGWVASAFWTTSDIRQEAQQEHIDLYGWQHLNLDDLTLMPTGCLTIPFDDIQPNSVCQASVEWYIEHDAHTALNTLDQAYDVRQFRGYTYALHAELLMESGDIDEAQYQAEVARFMGERFISSYVLGQLAESRGEDIGAISAYQSGTPEIPLQQAWTLAIYGRQGIFLTLPPLEHPGFTLHHMRSLQALALLYDRLDRPDDAARVRDRIKALTPYETGQP